MADSMCGPSNALQNFQKHSTIDRTLQQDRLISRQNQAQGFRSSPGPNAQHLDREFQAFQAGQLPLEQSFSNQSPGFTQASHRSLQPGPAGNWASDFQRLNISAPQAPAQFQQGFAQQSQNTSDWQHDFARHQSQMAGPTAGVSHIPQHGVNNQFATMSGGLGMGMGAQYAGGFVGTQEGSIVDQQQHAEQFDEEAFARAFDAAAKAEMEILQEGESSQIDAQLGRDILINESAERLMSSSPTSNSAQLVEQSPIGADTIYDPKQPQDQRQQEDPDAMARTAGRLLDSVKEDTSDKFKGSQFLELMRQFRDKEAIIKGDDIVGADGQPIHYQNTDTEGGFTESGLNEETLKKDIEILSRELHYSLLNHASPFIRTPSNVRRLLLNLLHIDRVLNSHNASISVLRNSDIIKTLKGAIASSSLNGLPSIRILAIYTLSAISNLTSLHPPTASDDLKSGAFSRNPSENLAEIATANREISSFENDDATSPFESSAAEPSLLSTPEYLYVSRCLSTSTSTEYRSEQSRTASLLGYSTTDTPTEDTAFSEAVHAQRARDILGPAISAVMDVCRARSMWASPLQPEQFFDLVEAYEQFGKQSTGFASAVRRVEVDVDREISTFLSRYLGGPGAGNMGNGEGEVLTMEEKLKSLDWLERPQLMKIGRERNPLAGETI